MAFDQDTYRKFILPALGVLETVATRGKSPGTVALGQEQIFRDIAKEARDAKEAESRAAALAGETARQSELFGLQKEKYGREKTDWDRENKKTADADKRRAKAIEKLIGIPAETDDSGAVIREALPGVEGLTELDKVAIQEDPISWLNAKLKPAPTQLLLDGATNTYQPVNRITGKTPEGKAVTAPPRPTPGTGSTKAPAGYRFKPDGSLEVIPGGPASGSKDPKEASDDMKKAATFGRRMELSMSQLDEVAKSGYDPTTAANAARNSALSPNFMNTPSGQLYENAKKNWVRANLRKESGAVIGAQEMADEMKVYFPVHGDSPEVVAQKALLRAQAFEGMKAAAGKQFEKVPSMIPVKTLGDAVDRSVAGIKETNPVIEELKKRARAGDKDAQAGLKAKGIAF